jgi:hypothetical protein
MSKSDSIPIEGDEGDEIHTAPIRFPLADATVWLNSIAEGGRVRIAGSSVGELAARRVSRLTEMEGQYFEEIYMRSKLTCSSATSFHQDMWLRWSHAPWERVSLWLARKADD